MMSNYEAMNEMNNQRDILARAATA